jgi:predicted phage replisome organizer
MPMGRPWIKLSTATFDDEKIKLIELLPEGDSILVIWLKLLCFAGKTDNDGVFKLTEKIPYNEEMLAGIFNRKLTTVRTALTVFQDYGMMEVIDGAYALPNWVKYQNDSDALNKSKEKNRLRQKKWYDKHKKTLFEATSQKSNVRSNNSNVSLTPTDIEEEVDIEGENNNNRRLQSLLFYQQNFHPISSEYEKELIESMVDDYGDYWTVKAMKEAIKNNVRKLKYVDAVLKNWKEHGFKKSNSKGETMADIKEKMDELLPDMPYDEAATRRWLYEEGIIDDLQGSDDTSGRSFSDVQNATGSDLRGYAQRHTAGNPAGSSEKHHQDEPVPSDRSGNS